MRGHGLVLAAVLMVLGAASGPALAAGCPCPKSQMVELYGSVSMFPKQLPGPRVKQPARPVPTPSISPVALPSMADVARAMPTPVLNRMGNPLLWDPVFVQK
jgi:hypothetical protein